MHSHERIDQRRGPGRERDDGRREIADGVTEYEEDRDAERADDYDSREDWGADQMDGPWNNPMADTPAFDDADITARVEDNRIVIEVPIPAGTSPERWAKIAEDLKRRIAVKLTAAGHRIRSAEPTPEIP